MTSPGRLWGKIRTLGWFLARPRFYGQAIRAVRFRLFPHPGEQTRDRATQWCRERAVTTAEALDRLLGPGARWPLSELEPERYRCAREVAGAVPVFMGGPGDLDLLFHLAGQGGVLSAVETGVAFGWSSLAMLLGMAPGGRLFSTDMPYVRGNNEDYVGCVVPEDLRGGWTLTRLPDRQALPGALKAAGGIQLCHYDSDKTYVGRMWAYALLWDALEPGGYFVSDDVSDNEAFREFSESVEREPTVIRPGTDGEKYVGVLVKGHDT